MIELLILTILSENKNTIYGIKQEIKDRFSLFLKTSFGTLHPALKKLEKSRYISCKSELSSGGHRKSTYSITSSGKEYFNSLIEDDLPVNSAFANELMNIKLLMIPKISPDRQKSAANSIIRYLEYQKTSAENILNNLDDKDVLTRKIIKYNIDKFSEDIRLVSGLV